MKDTEALLQALNSLNLAGNDQTWVLDEGSGAICLHTDTGFHPVLMTIPVKPDEEAPVESIASPTAQTIVQLLNTIPSLVSALQRALEFAEGLEDMALMRERAAHAARLSERYDLSEVHRQSAKRVRSTKQAFLMEMSDALQLNTATTEPLP